MIFEQGVYRLDVDVERTRAYYRAEGGITCDCAGCRNFAALEERMPQHIDGFLRQFGIDPAKPVEVSAVHAPAPDEIIYSGSYYICGVMLEGTDPWVPAGPKRWALREGYEIRFGIGEDSVNFFDDTIWTVEEQHKPIFRVNVCFEAPWVLDEENPYQ